MPDELEVSSTADDGIIMAMRHRALPVEAVQFHPESVLTPYGPGILRSLTDDLAGARAA